MSSFIDTLDCVTAETRALLAEHEFTTAVQIAARGEAYFEAAPYNLKPGRATALLLAARQAAGLVAAPATTPARIEIVTPDRERQIGEALRERPVKPRRLLGLKVRWVVQGPNAGEVDADKTESMLAATDSTDEDLAGRTWYGSPVIAVADLLPPRWINPRTGRPLQGFGADGIDEVTLLPWGKLGEEGLKLAVLAEREGFTRGMTDEQVIEALTTFDRPATHPSPLQVKVTARIKALGLDLRDVDIVVRDARPTRLTGGASIPTIDIPDHSIKLEQAGFRELLELVEGSFNTDEMRRLASILPDGSRILSALPGGNVGAAQLAFALVDIIRRWSLVGRLLRDAMVSVCPARRDDFDRFFLRIAGRPVDPGLRGRFARFLLARFGAGELRRLVRYLPNGGLMEQSLPSSEQSAAAIADGVVITLDAHGYLDGSAGTAFWDSFRRERPRGIDEINQWQDALRGGR